MRHTANSIYVVPNFYSPHVANFCLRIIFNNQMKFHEILSIPLFAACWVIFMTSKWNSWKVIGTSEIFSHLQFSIFTAFAYISLLFLWMVTQSNFYAFQTVSILFNARWENKKKQMCGSVILCAVSVDRYFFVLSRRLLDSPRTKETTHAHIATRKSQSVHLNRSKLSNGVHSMLSPSINCTVNNADVALLWKWK